MSLGRSWFLSKLWEGLVLYVLYMSDPTTVGQMFWYQLGDHLITPNPQSLREREMVPNVLKRKKKNFVPPPVEGLPY